MKALITTLIALVFLFTAPTFAGKSDRAGKGRHAKKQIKTHSRAMEAKTDDKVKKIKKRKREQAKERIKEAEEVKEEKQEKVREKRALYGTY